MQDVPILLWRKTEEKTDLNLCSAVVYTPEEVFGPFKNIKLHTFPWQLYVVPQNFYTRLQCVCQMLFLVGLVMTVKSEPVRDIHSP